MSGRLRLRPLSHGARDAGGPPGESAPLAPVLNSAAVRSAGASSPVPYLVIALAQIDHQADLVGAPGYVAISVQQPDGRRAITIDREDQPGSALAVEEDEVGASVILRVADPKAHDLRAVAGK
jgi:hypothetical protein